MVHFLSESSESIPCYAETDHGVLNAETSERAIQYADPTNVHARAKAGNAIRTAQGYWIDPETIDRKYLWANGEAPLPDVLPGFVVSSRFREMVEEFEPILHQFVPVEIYKSRTGSPVATYYWFVVGQRIDSVDREHTTYKWETSKEDADDGHWTNYIIETSPLKMTEIEGARLVFSNSKSAGHHIWHDPHVLTFNNGLCSDEFANVLFERAFSGVTATPRDSV